MYNSMPSQIRHLMKASGLSRAPAAFSLKKKRVPDIHCIESLTGPSVGLKVMLFDSCKLHVIRD
jgi:hypothetical protein